MTKRTIALLLIIMLLSAMTLSANAVGPQPMYVYAISSYTALSIPSTTAYCDGDVTGTLAVNSIGLLMQLQMKVGSSWYTQRQWTSTTYSNSAYISGTNAVSSGEEYRVKVRYSLYTSGGSEVFYRYDYENS